MGVNNKSEVPSAGEWGWDALSEGGSWGRFSLQRRKERVGTNMSVLADLVYEHGANSIQFPD